MKSKIKIVKRFTVMAFMLLLIPAGMIFSQDTDTVYYKHEFTIGLGYTYGFEKHILNVPDDYSVNSAAGLTLGYCYNLSGKTGIGIRLFGNFKTLPAYITYFPNNQSRIQYFEANTVNFDGVFRYVFKTGKVEPYGLVMFGFTEGGVRSTNEDFSSYGFNAGAGAGIKFKTIEDLMMSFEIIGTLGYTSYETKPVVHSGSDYFNPSMIMLMLNLSYVFGSEKRGK